MTGALIHAAWAANEWGYANAKFKIFGLRSNGDVSQYIHQKPEPGAWHNASGKKMPKLSSPNFKEILVTMRGSFYGIKANGDLYRGSLKNKRYTTVDRQGFKKIGSGWGNFKTVIVRALSSYHIFYAIKNNGDLVWYRYKPKTNNWVGPKKIGNGWGSMVDISADKTVYGNRKNTTLLMALTKNGEFKIYEHKTPKTGSASWGKIKTIATGWNHYSDIFGGASGVLYTRKWSGELYVHKYDPRYPFNKSKWQNAVKVGKGWQSFKDVELTQ